jgi:hypothetical protein
MGLRDILAGALSAGLKAVSNVGAKSVTGPLKDVSGAAKDVTGIRKDIVETKLAEIKVEDHESRITRPTLEDVKKFDLRSGIFTAENFALPSAPEAQR